MRPLINFLQSISKAHSPPMKLLRAKAESKLKEYIRAV